MLCRMLPEPAGEPGRPAGHVARTRRLTRHGGFNLEIVHILAGQASLCFFDATHTLLPLSIACDDGDGFMLAYTFDLRFFDATDHFTWVPSSTDYLCSELGVLFLLAADTGFTISKLSEVKVKNLKPSCRFAYDKLDRKADVPTAIFVELLRARPTTLGEAFSLARITKDRFEAIAHKEKATAEKEQTIKETSEALETRSDDLEKKMLDLNPTLHDLLKVVVDQKKKRYKTKRALKINDEEFKKSKYEATTKIRKLT
ncbi:hypothetical protein Tco_0761612 [Tanacetum coccineum]